MTRGGGGVQTPLKDDIIYEQPLIVQGSALHVSAVHCLEQCSAVLCSAIKCNAAQCSAFQFGAVRCGVVQCDTVPCSALLSLPSFRAAQTKSRGFSFQRRTTPSPPFLLETVFVLFHAGSQTGKLVSTGLFWFRLV